MIMLLCNLLPQLENGYSDLIPIMFLCWLIYKLIKQRVIKTIFSTIKLLK